jgi:hypothetical protein
MEVEFLSLQPAFLCSVGRITSESFFAVPLLEYAVVKASQYLRSGLGILKPKIDTGKFLYEMREKLSFKCTYTARLILCYYTQLTWRCTTLSRELTVIIDDELEKEMGKYPYVDWMETIRELLRECIRRKEIAEMYTAPVERALLHEK